MHTAPIRPAVLFSDAPSKPYLEKLARMATPNDTQAVREADYERFKHYAALTFLVASPVLIALPPRKLDHLTVLLTGAFCASANHITRERTGRSIVDRLEARLTSSSSHKPGSPGMFGDLPSDRAAEIQARLRAARDAQLRDAGLTTEEIEKLKVRQQQDKGMAQRIWMGSETEGWKERRLREEQKALDEGKGYGDLIKEHIWDVWTWGKRDESEAQNENAEKKD
jgi:hypothetical protein